jgi:YfiH family protein
MEWELLQTEGCTYYRFQWQHVSMMYSTKHGQEQFLQRTRPFLVKQMHSNTIINVDEDDSRTGDGLVSGDRRSSLGIKIADCLPVFLFNETRVCIIHCGWRGIISGIAQKAARLMTTYNYVLGASIGPCCYEVKDDVSGVFKKQYNSALVSRNGRFHLDLKAAVIQDLGDASLYGSLDLCTKCHPEHFYSYRAGDKGKRNYAVINTTLDQV